MTRRLTLIALLCFVGLVPASASAYLPTGFVGISPQSVGKSDDYDLMETAEIDSVRLLLSWAAIESASPYVDEPNWAGFDHEVKLAAEHDMEIFPVVFGSPEWVAAETTVLPVGSILQRSAWAQFLREAVDRYGPAGEFWLEHPALPRIPIRRWEIWNEQNIVNFATPPDPVRYARLLRISGRVLHRADPGSKVIVGGFFGRPLQVPPNVASGDFLRRIYRAGDVKRFFDGVALHPYVARATAIYGQIENLRRIMRANGDAATPFYVTELGWGSDSGPTRWERGMQGQADQLSRSFRMFSNNRLRWNLRGVWWFTWSDEGGNCLFCSSAGLLTKEREAKPSWYRFNAWTGGDPETVPRAFSDD
jgi:polysaccharide biosynthesis protein PslG